MAQSTPLWLRTLGTTMKLMKLADTSPAFKKERFAHYVVTHSDVVVPKRPAQEGALALLPPEILLLIFDYTDDVTAVCLSLASIHLYDVYEITRLQPPELWDTMDLPRKGSLMEHLYQVEDGSALLQTKPSLIWMFKLLEDWMGDEFIYDEDYGIFRRRIIFGEYSAERIC